MSAIEDHLAPIRARADAAAEGPWEVADDPLSEGDWMVRQVNVPPDCPDDVAAVIGHESTAEFIAEARTDIPRLLAAVDAALTLAKAYIDHSDRPQIGHDIRAAVEAGMEGQDMTWLPETDMTGLHKIRQEFARARQAHEQAPSPETAAAFEEATARRARAIRTVHREDGASVAHLSGMFRCSKTTIRAALEGDQE